MKAVADQVSYSYGNSEVLKGIDLVLPKGVITGLVGPNGSGKTTLMKLLSKSLALQKGKITIEGQSILRLTSKELARRLSVVSQEREIDFDFTVEELVMMGRYPYKRLFDSETMEDRRLVERVLAAVHLLESKHHTIQSLSGGEKQRALIARTLAQQTDLIILDEPTNHLDIYHQIQLFELFKELEATVCAGVHDLNFAMTYCDYLLVMKDGQIVAHGKPVDVLTSELIEEVYQVKTDIVYHEQSNKHVIVYL